MPFLEVASGDQEEHPLPPLRLSRDEPDSSKPTGPRPGARLQEVEIQPQPSFVLKTLLQTPFTNPVRLFDYPEGTKIFINVSYAEQVPEQVDERSLVPCLISDVRECEDKSGKTSLVVDSTIPPLAAAKCKQDKSYKQWMIQVILERVEEKMNAELSRDYAEPNLKSKGPLVPRRAVVPVNPSSDAPPIGTGSKIQVLDDSTTAAGKAAAVPLPLAVGPESGNGKMTARHEFELREKGSRFVFSLFLPEEDPAVVGDVRLELSPDALEFESVRYQVSVKLPLDVNVASVLEEGTEWSIADKAIRVRGRMAGR